MGGRIALTSHPTQVMQTSQLWCDALHTCRGGLIASRVSGKERPVFPCLNEFMDYDFASWAGASAGIYTGIDSAA